MRRLPSPMPPRNVKGPDANLWGVCMQGLFADWLFANMPPDYLGLEARQVGLVEFHSS